jgi:hypothetical protein
VAWRAVVAVLERIGADGEMKYASFGTATGHDLQHYKDIPLASTPHGQAMAMMMLVEVSQIFYRFMSVYQHLHEGTVSSQLISSLRRHSLILNDLPLCQIVLLSRP